MKQVQALENPQGQGQSAVERLVSPSHPYDGREWDCQCARCGSSLDWHECENCEDGFSGHDCGEDCCCCLNPEDNIRCDICDGEGGWWSCFSSSEWCEAHPMEGREKVKSGSPEWFCVG